MPPIGLFSAALVKTSGAKGACSRMSARTRWARKEWVRCPTAVPVHFEQDSLSAPPRRVSIRDRRPRAPRRP
eukprot:8318775-Pyramimonas_sp.AAC.1